MASKNNSKSKSKKDEFAISKIHNILKARKIDYILKEVHLVEKFSDDRTKYKLIYEVIGELKEREETVIIIDGGEENIDTPSGGDGNKGDGGEIKPIPTNDPEWKIYMNKVRDELREEFHKELDTGLNELRQEFSQELSKTEIRLLKVINENNEKTNKRIDGIEDTLKQILSILKDKK
ncbi:hypothetical protein [Mycoplasmopsis agassizii]|uniref:Uncharacterized protein n=1 Tax=Mycoplasmopsis agassizii TaxID=33922 RepID=A0ABX4H5M4_9BACT|nr:hypothetical protein [Mycoplasmopsis agassizii]PAF55199.1 hypothetical protein CJF60_00735 [Mycoplasmopsis agassizii]SMC19877.1 hypothetical protein SAMN02745179_00969 [Mycoplasmopsis agassizii]